METTGNSAPQRHLSAASIPLQAPSLQAPSDGTPSVLHDVLFSCPIYDRLRAPFKSTAALLGLSWPPDESSIAGEKSLWNEMSKFITGTKRLQVSSIFPS